jgi:hypothetical protein
MTIDNHVKFDHIDEQEENERSFRGFEHRKDLVVSERMVSLKIKC